VGEPLKRIYKAGQEKKGALHSTVLSTVFPGPAPKCLFSLCLCDRTFDRNYFLLFLVVLLFLSFVFRVPAFASWSLNQQRATIYSSTIAHEEEYALSAKRGQPPNQRTGISYRLAYALRRAS
jgi:hypothetical protein